MKVASVSVLLAAAIGSLGGATCALADEKADLAAALVEFQLPESSKPAKELIPAWQAPKKLVVVVDKPARTAWLQEAMPKGVTVIGVARDAEAKPLVADADALVNVDCGTAVSDNAPRLRWVHAASAGSDGCMRSQGVARGEIVLTNSQKVKNTGLSEMAMGYVFALARSIDVGLENQRQREINRRGRPGKRLEGSTMLVIGLGGSGTEIARVAHAVGMKVIATDPVNRNKPDFVAQLADATETPRLLAEADVVMVCAPLTPQTRGMFNAAMFARMKKDAMFVNWARADIVVPEDLAAALESGTIGSAALNWATDVPLTKDNPLWGRAEPDTLRPGAAWAAAHRRPSARRATTKSAGW